jgi:hypothetical protein
MSRKLDNAAWEEYVSKQKLSTTLPISAGGCINYLKKGD